MSHLPGKKALAPIGRTDWSAFRKSALGNQNVVCPNGQIGGPHDDVRGQLLGVIGSGAAAEHEPVVEDAHVEIVNLAAELALDMFFKLRDFFGAEVIQGLYAAVHLSTLLTVKSKALAHLTSCFDSSRRGVHFAAVADHSFVSFSVSTISERFSRPPTFPPRFLT